MTDTTKPDLGNEIIDWVDGIITQELSLESFLEWINQHFVPREAGMLRQAYIEGYRKAEEEICVLGKPACKFLDDINPTTLNPNTITITLSREDFTLSEGNNIPMFTDDAYNKIIDMALAKWPVPDKDK